MTSECDYKNLTSRFKDTLDIPGEMFDPKYDLCFCDGCHKKRGNKDHYMRGKPPKIYVLPIGWRRFGINTKFQQKESTKGWKKWHVAFHGTQSKSLGSILRDGLKIPGELMYNGKEISELYGHFNDKKKPDGFNTKQIFVSPSIRYAGCDAYAPTKRFEDQATETTYNCKTVFQLRIKPETYNVGQKTTSQNKIDNYIDDSKLEWSTKTKDFIILTGILVQMDRIPQTPQIKRQLAPLRLPDVHHVPSLSSEESSKRPLPEIPQKAPLSRSDVDDVPQTSLGKRSTQPLPEIPQRAHWSTQPLPEIRGRAPLSRPDVHHVPSLSSEELSSEESSKRPLPEIPQKAPLSRPDVHHVIIRGKVQTTTSRNSVLCGYHQRWGSKRPLRKIRSTAVLSRPDVHHGSRLTLVKRYK